jgi:hypothetical protein
LDRLDSIGFDKNGSFDIVVDDSSLNLRWVNDGRGFFRRDSILGSAKITFRDQFGNPVLGVIVSSISQPNWQPALNGVSSADGSLAFNSILPGDYIVEAKLRSYVSLTGSLNVISGNTADVAFTMQPLPTTGGLKIAVKDVNGVGIPSVIVSSTSQPSGQAALSGATGVDGTVVFNEVLPGGYAVLVSKSGYVASTGSRDVTVGSTMGISVILQAQQSSSGGIPVFTYEAIICGVFLSVFLLRMKFTRLKML